MRSGDTGDEAARSAEDAELPLDLAAVRADDDLIEALAAGLVPPPSGPRDPGDVEGELVALLAGWVADVRPETLLHRPGMPVAVQLRTSAADSTEEDKPLAAVGAAHSGRSLLEYEDAEPVAISRWRSRGARAYLLRAAAGLVAVALIGSGVIVRSYDAHPGDSLWVVAKVVFPAKSRSVEAATAVSTALNTARVALESGRIEDARAAFQTVQDQLGAVDDADGRVELAHQRDYLTTQLGGVSPAAAERTSAPAADAPLATGQAGATIPSGPAITPGATRALSTPSPSVLAGPSEASGAAPSGGAPTGSGSASAPEVVAAPSGDPALSAPPAASSPAPHAASDAASGSAPVASPPIDGSYGSSADSPPVAAPPADAASNPPAPAPSPGPPATSAPAAPPATAPPTADPPADNGASSGASGGSDTAANAPAIAPDSASGSSGGASDASASNKSADSSSGSGSSDSSSGGSSSSGSSSSGSGSSGSSSSGSGSSDSSSSGGSSSGGSSSDSGSSGGSSSGGSSSGGSSSDGGSSGGSSSSGSSSSGSSSSGSSGGGSSVAAGADISVDGLAGSTLGAVTGVVASTTGS